jgi:hypothetical protein
MVCLSVVSKAAKQFGENYSAKKGKKMYVQNHECRPGYWEWKNSAITKQGVACHIADG